MAALPSPSATCQVAALPTGWLSLPRKWLFAEEEDSEELDRTPDYSFYIIHRPSGKKVMFDLGLNKDMSVYSPAIHEDLPIVLPEVPHDAANLLLAGGAQPSEIDHIIFSHLHWDHIGDPAKFPKAQIVVGPGAIKAGSPGWPPQNGPFHSWALKPPSGNIRELSYEKDEWKAVGPFPRALDFFGDGSMYLVDTPGHMAGHLGALACTGENEWVFLGGDVCHARHFLSPCCWDIGTTYGPGPTTSMHANPTLARQSIRQVAEVHQANEVFVAIAHDPVLEGVIPEFPLVMNGWRERGDKVRCKEKEKDLMPIKPRQETCAH